jgi:hypothetical protein
LTAPDEYTISLPDLRGFAEQVGHLAQFYNDIEDFFTKINTDEFLNEALGTQSQWETGGALSGVLRQFCDQFLNLATAEGSASTRMCQGFDATAKSLLQTAQQYDAKDRAALAELEATDELSEEERDAAEVTADSVTGGEPNSDWRERLAFEDYVTGDPLDVRYRSPKMEYVDAMSGVEGTYGQIVSGSIVGTLDSIFQDLLGFSAIKEVIKPLLGNWGFLWFMRDQFHCVANAVDAADQLFAKGTATLTAEDWTGSAADGFVRKAESWHTALQEHGINLRTAAVLLGDLGDQMEVAVTKIVPMLVTLADIGIAAIESALTLNPLAVAGAVLSSAIDLTIQDFQPVLDALDGLISLVDASATSTEELCAATDDLMPG